MGRSMKKTIGVAIIGCGLIGQKRAKFLQENDELVGCVDLDIKKAKLLADDWSICTNDYIDITRGSDADIIIVATPNKFLAEIAIDALCHNKHVLIEKPAGINSNEILKIINASVSNNKKVWVGYNHRWHPAPMVVRSMIKDGVIGEVMYCRGLYGHGGRKGMETEWRAGVGELVDQGSHLIDLASWFFDHSEWCHVDGLTPSYFWDGYTDDNAFMTLVNKNNQTAFLHASCTEWRNMFQFEIYGKLGKLRIDGLGGSYGIERLTWYDMSEQNTFPIITSWEYPQPDESWAKEWTAFKNVIKYDLNPTSSIYDALDVIETIEKIKRANDNY